MLNVKVKERFIDIHTGFIHEVGEIFEATEERIAEIKSKKEDLIEVVQQRSRRKKVNN